MLLQWKMRGRITVTQTRCSALQLTLGQQLSRLLPLGLVERETGMAFSKSSLSNSNPALHFLQPQHLTPVLSLWVPVPVMVLTPVIPEQIC